MNELNYFIKNFIAKNRQDRWLSLANGKWVKFTDKLSKLENHLNEKCTLVENNSYDIFTELIKKEEIKHGIYIDRNSEMIEMRPIDITQIYYSSLLICIEKNRAFYFHHEGWIWFCVAPQRQN